MEEDKNLMWLLILIVIAFNFLDMVVTITGVERLGIEYEGNPVVVCHLQNNPLYWLRHKILGSMVVLVAGFVVDRVKHKQAVFIFNYTLACVIGILNFLTMTWIGSMLSAV